MKPSSQPLLEPDPSSDSIVYGIDSPLPHPPEGCFNTEVAESRFGVAATQLQEFVKEGLLIPVKSNGVFYFTDRDGEWSNMLKRLRDEAHLSCADIRELIGSRCRCWQVRHCEFHARNDCPVNTDSSLPCWTNRAGWSVLLSHPCYCCVAYRSTPSCPGLRALLSR